MVKIRVWHFYIMPKEFMDLKLYCSDHTVSSNFSLWNEGVDFTISNKIQCMYTPYRTNVTVLLYVKNTFYFRSSSIWVCLCFLSVLSVTNKHHLRVSCIKWCRKKWNVMRMIRTSREQPSKLTQPALFAITSHENVWSGSGCHNTPSKWHSSWVHSIQL